MDAENVLAAEAGTGGLRLEGLLADLREHFKPVNQLVVVVGADSAVWHTRVMAAAERSLATVVTARSNPDVLLALEDLA